MPNSNLPIFFHSLFRSGSTYMFHAFRRLDQLYCYQEPVHEIVLQLADWSGSLDDLLQTNPALRHPPVGTHYYSELFATKQFWKDKIEEDFIYHGAITNTASKKLVTYLTSLIENAPKRALIQECRTIWRMGSLKKLIPGHHIALHRHPWDQWYSYKATEYFDVANQVLLGSSNLKGVFQALTDRIAFTHIKDRSIADQFAHYSAHRISPEHNYLLFFTLWMKAQVESIKHADFEIDMNQLSNNQEYREQCTDRFENLGIAGIDFSDCHTPVLEYGRADHDFFEPLQQEVLSWFEGDKTAARLVPQIRQRLASAVKPISAEAPSHLGLIRSIESREAQKLEEMRDQLYTLKTKVTQSEGLDSRLKKTEADLGTAIHRRDELFGQLESALKQHANAETNFQQQQQFLELTLKHAEIEIDRLNQNLHEAEKAQAALAVTKLALAEAKTENETLVQRLADKSAKASELLSQFNEEQLIRARMIEVQKDILTDLRNTREQLGAETKSHSNYVVSIEQKLHDSALKTDELQLELSEKSSEAQQFKVREAELAQAIVELRTLVDIGTAEYEAIQNSTSWRIMAPARMIVRSAQGVFGKFSAMSVGMIRHILALSLSSARFIPGAPTAIRYILTPFPPLKRKILHFASIRPRRGIKSNVLASTIKDPSQPLQLAPSNHQASSTECVPRNAQRLHLAKSILALYAQHHLKK